MVKQTYEFIAGKLRLMKLFEKVFTYAELIETSGGGKYPAYYVGNGVYKPINISDYAGMAYIRKTAPIRFEEETRESLVGCERYDLAVMPLRIVVAVKKTLLTKCDPTFGAEFMIEELYSTLSGRFNDLSESAGVNDSSIVVQSSEADRMIILNEEYSGAEFNELPFDWILVAMDIEAKLVFNRKCIDKFCHGYDYATDPGTGEPCPPVDPCPECDECPPEVAGVLCDYSIHVFVPLASEDGDPEESFLHTITQEGGPDIIIADYGDQMASDTNETAIFDAFVNAGIDISVLQVNINRISDQTPPEFVINITGSPAILKTGAVRRRGDSSDLDPENFVRSNCRVPLECPPDSLGENMPIEYIPTSELWVDHGSYWRHEGSSGDILNLHYTTGEEGWYLFEIDLSENTNGFHITGAFVTDVFAAGLYKFAFFNTESDNGIQISPIDANAIVTFNKSSVKLRRIL